MISSNLAKTFRSFSSYAKALKNIPTVDSKIVWLNCQDKNGNWHRLSSYEGESLLKAINRACLPITQTCQGNEGVFTMTEKPIEPMMDYPNCKECHVVLGDGWFKQNDIHPTEWSALLNNTKFMKKNNSRFACAVRVEPWMQEMRFQIGQVIYTSNEDLPYQNWFRRAD